MTKDSIIEQALMRIKVTDGTNQIGEYLSDAMDEYVALINKEPVTFLLSNALRHLTQDQQRQLCNALLERLPVPASLEQEANRLYPHPQETYVSPDGVTKMYSNDNKCKAEGYITAARQYMGEIEKLRAENEKMRKALEEIAQKYADAEVIDDIGQFVFEMGEIATSALKTTTHG